MLKNGPACLNGSKKLRSLSDVLGRCRSQKRRQTLYQVKISREKIIFLHKTERTNTDFACLGSRALSLLPSDSLRFHHLPSIFPRTTLHPRHPHRLLHLVPLLSVPPRPSLQSVLLSRMQAPRHPHPPLEQENLVLRLFYLLRHLLRPSATSHLPHQRRPLRLALVENR